VKASNLLALSYAVLNLASVYLVR